MNAALNSSSPWLAVESSAHALFVNPDMEAVRINLAAVAAQRMADLCPAWILSIAPPGSGKTELDNAIDQFPGLVWSVDQITPNTLLSGLMSQSKKRKPASLLHRIGKFGILIIKDLSTYLGNKQSLAVIMGQLRRVHDGAFRPEFGTQDNYEPWQGRITLLASITPEIDAYTGVLNKMGPRFVFVRWPRAGGVEVGRRALENRTESRSAFQAAVKNQIEFVNNLDVYPPKLTDEQAGMIAAGCELVAVSRGTVHRTSGTREVDVEAVIESNTRLPEQITQIARGSAILEGRSTVNDVDMRLALRAARDTIPQTRSRVLRSVGRGVSPYEKGMPRVLVHRTLEDLKMTGVLTGDEDADVEIAPSILDLEQRSGIFQVAENQ